MSESDQRAQIVSGELPLGAQLPTHKQLAEQHGIEEIAVAPQLWAITVRGPDGRRYPARHVCEDINRPDSFRAHLLAIARIECPIDTDRGESWIGDYELEIREPGKEDEDPKLRLRWQVS